MQGPPVEIDLDRIEQCHTLDPTTVAAFVIAARVCLSRHHDSSLLERVTATHTHDGGQQPSLQIRWRLPDARMRATHANDEDAARDGAYAIAIVAVHANLGLRFVRRERAQLGYDWVAEGTVATASERVVVEVSGLLIGTEESNSARARLRQKRNQIEAGGSLAAKLAIVVDFRPVDIAVLSATAGESTAR